MFFYNLKQNIKNIAENTVMNICYYDYPTIRLSEKLGNKNVDLHRSDIQHTGFYIKHSQVHIVRELLHKKDLTLINCHFQMIFQREVVKQLMVTMDVLAKL